MAWFIVTRYAGKRVSRESTGLGYLRVWGILLLGKSENQSLKTKVSENQSPSSRSDDTCATISIVAQRSRRLAPLSVLRQLLTLETISWFRFNTSLKWRKRRAPATSPRRPQH